MSDDAEPAAEFPRDLFDAAVVMHGKLYLESTVYLEVKRGQRKLTLANARCKVVVDEHHGALRVGAKTAAERALVADIQAPLRAAIAHYAAQKAEACAYVAALPVHSSPAFGRAEFDAMIAEIEPYGDGGQVRFDDATTFHTWRGAWDRLANVMFIRKASSGEYTRVTVYDLDGTLHSDAKPDQAAFVDEVGALAMPALDRLIQRKAQFAAEAVAKAKAIDRDVLVEALKALTHLRVDVQPIAKAIMLASTDPRGYIAANRELCAEWGISEPVENLHVTALRQHLGADQLVHCDWKDSTADVVPRLANLLRAGPNVTLDLARYQTRYEAWDRKQLRSAIKELAKEIRDAILVEIETGGDSYAFACIAPRDYPRLRAFRSKAHLPITALAKPT